MISSQASTERETMMKRLPIRATTVAWATRMISGEAITRGSASVLYMKRYYVGTHMHNLQSFSAVTMIIFR